MNPEDRQALIRCHFEAVRDITWAADLEPRHKAAGADAAQMKAFREAWNRFAEARDWPWWQTEAGRYSDERLQDMMMDTVELGDALGMMQWQGQQEQQRLDTGAGQALAPEYRLLLAGASMRPAANDNERGLIDEPAIDP